MMGIFLRIEVAAISRSTGLLLISDPKLTDNSAFSGVPREDGIGIYEAVAIK
jgi:hypothetical protein